MRKLGVMDIKLGTKLYPKAYSVWSSILRRVSGKGKPCYYGVSVCAEWLTFSVFKEWFDDNYVDGWAIDKDLFGDSTIYSPDTCCFIPKRLNSMLVGLGSSGVEPVVGGKWRASISIDSKTTHIGVYDTEDEAHTAYTEVKLNRLLEVAQECNVPQHIIDRVNSL